VAADAGVVLGDSMTLAVAAFAHAGPVRRALAALKYSGAAVVAAPLAAAATPSLRALLEVTGQATLVSVPLHRDRHRERGYNQAELIGQELARRVGLPCAEAVERWRPTTQQHRLDRAARLANLRAAFRVVPGAPLAPTVILVDDILTTSATLEACASVLIEAGVTRVYGFTVAREI
jgi:ComF family protein